jgi:hypothetical protein
VRISFRRLGIAFGAMVEAGLILWLFGGFLPAGLLVVLLAVLLGAAIYQDIIRRDAGPGSRIG